MTFDPFENRLSRDIRNQLGDAFFAAVKSGNKKELQNRIQHFKTKALNPETISYIDSRKEKLNIIFDRMAGKTDFFEIFTLFWKNRLYFEAHEWVEKKWIQALGNEKKWLQAIIRACVAFEQFEYQRIHPAKKLAQKALTVLEQNASQAPDPEINQTLIRDLKRICQS